MAAWIVFLIFRTLQRAFVGRCRRPSSCHVWFLHRQNRQGQSQGEDHPLWRHQRSSRQQYMDMAYNTMDKDGNVKTLPLFGDINVHMPKYTFSHPTGFLFATQFAQIALVVTEKAAFEDMRPKGFVQKGRAFAGHSLGEYSALASIADVLPVSSLVDVVFYRGIPMQRAVERDSENRSNYAMCAVNPSRISKTFSDAALREVVDSIAVISGSLLEIVNYNVEVRSRSVFHLLF